MTVGTVLTLLTLQSFWCPFTPGEVTPSKRSKPKVANVQDPNSYFRRMPRPLLLPLNLAFGPDPRARHVAIRVGPLGACKLRCCLTAGHVPVAVRNERGLPLRFALVPGNIWRIGARNPWKACLLCCGTEGFGGCRGSRRCITGLRRRSGEERG